MINKVNKFVGKTANLQLRIFHRTRRCYLERFPLSIGGPTSGVAGEGGALPKIAPPSSCQPQVRWNGRLAGLTSGRVELQLLLAEVNP